MFLFLDPRSIPPGFGLANRLRYEHSTYAIPPPAGQVAPVSAYSTLPAHPADAEYNFLMVSHVTFIVSF